MQFNEVTFTDAQPVSGYGPGFFRIGEQVFSGDLCVTAAGVTPWGGYDDLKPLLALADEIDVLFVGTGAEIAPIPAQLRDPLEAAGVGVEMMSTPAAARTYNVLVSEGRRVAAALLTV